MSGDQMAFQDEQEELILQLAELEKELEIMRAENQIFETYYTIKAQNDPSLVDDPKKRQNRRKIKLPTTLLPEQRCEVVNLSLDELQKEAEESKRKSEKLIETMKAVSEEVDLRIAELKKSAYEFKRDIVVGAENARTGKTIAEKVLRYMEEKLRQRDEAIDKLRLKNATIKAQITKAENQLNQKEEMGDILHYIDFHQLQIENKQYVVKIEDLNDELIKFKETAGKTGKALSKAKAELEHHLQDKEDLEKNIGYRGEQLRKVKEENANVKNEIMKEKRLRKRLSQEQTEAAGVPQVLDYVAQKAEMYELQSAVQNWEKKVEIMRLSLKKTEQVNRGGGPAFKSSV